MEKKIVFLFFLLLEMDLLEASFVNYNEVSVFLDKNFNLNACFILVKGKLISFSDEYNVPLVAKKYCLGLGHKEAEERFEAARKNKKLGLPSSRVLEAWWIKKHRNLQERKKILREEIESRQKRLSVLEETGEDPGESSEEDWVEEEEEEEEIRLPKLEEIIKEYKKTNQYRVARSKELRKVKLVDFSQQKIFLNEMIYDERFTPFLSFRKIEKKTRFRLHKNKRDKVRFFRIETQQKYLSHRKIKEHLRKIGIPKPKKKADEEEGSSSQVFSFPSLFLRGGGSSLDLDLVSDFRGSF